MSKPTEWLNFTKSDVLYTSSNSKNSNSLPPIVVEVQYTGNMPFYCRLIDYGLSVTKRNSASSVVLAIIIHNTTTELTNLAVASEKLPFLLELPCHGWAESCYLLNSSSISDQLQLTSLTPLVALGHFPIQKKPSLRRIDWNDDKTIQSLYTIAQQIFGDGLKENESVITAEDLDEIHDRCTRAKSYLLKDALEESSGKRALDCLDRVLVRINEPRKKPIGSVLSNNDNDFVIKDWQSVDKYYEDHGSLNWETIFKLGKAKELFDSYSKWTSAKSAYYQFQKQKQ